MWILVLLTVTAIAVFLIYPKGKSKEMNTPPEKLKEHINEGKGLIPEQIAKSFLIEAINNSQKKIDLTARDFKTFREKRPDFEALISYNFLWHEIAIISVREEIHREIDQIELVDKVFYAGQKSIHEPPFQLIFRDNAKKIFIDNVETYAQALRHFLMKNNDSSDEFSFGAYFLRDLMTRLQSPDEPNDEDKETASYVGGIMDKVVVHTIFGEQDPLRKKTSEPLTIRIDDAARSCNVEFDEFCRYYQGYLESLSVTGESNWNIDIDELALKKGILSESDIEQAKNNINQAALNRTIYKYKIAIH